MSKDMFELDVQVKSSHDEVNPQITSVAFCTPGTCHDGCNTGTFASNCCPSNYTLCITKTCITCA